MADSNQPARHAPRRLRTANRPHRAQLSLALPEPAPWAPQALPQTLAPGACLLPGFALGEASALVQGIENVLRAAPLRRMQTPGGRWMSVRTSCCGELGWVADSAGYRYTSLDPEYGEPWPTMPVAFQTLAGRAAARAGYEGFVADSCLINCYAVGTRMHLHQDRDEQDLGSPIVSVSLGLACTFLFGGLQRGDRPARVTLRHGDVVVWGGPARLRFHGVLPLTDGDHPCLGRQRINLTFRRAA